MLCLCTPDNRIASIFSMALMISLSRFWMLTVGRNYSRSSDCAYIVHKKDYSSPRSLSLAFMPRFVTSVLCITTVAYSNNLQSTFGLLLTVGDLNGPGINRKKYALTFIPAQKMHFPWLLQRSSVAVPFSPLP